MSSIDGKNDHQATSDTDLIASSEDQTSPEYVHYAKHFRGYMFSAAPVEKVRVDDVAAVKEAGHVMSKGVKIALIAMGLFAVLCIALGVGHYTLSDKSADEDQELREANGPKKAAVSGSCTIINAPSTGLNLLYYNKNQFDYGNVKTCTPQNVLLQNGDSVTIVSSDSAVGGCGDEPTSVFYRVRYDKTFGMLSANNLDCPNKSNATNTTA